MSLGGPTGYAMNGSRPGSRIAHAILPIAGKAARTGLCLDPCLGSTAGAFAAYVVAMALNVF